MSPGPPEPLAVEARTTDWLTGLLGSPVRVVRSLSFGMTSELELVEGAGELFVLRRYTAGDILERHPGLVADEVRVLRAAHSVLGALVPEPVGFDTAGTDAGLPALVMTYLPGSPVIHGLDPAQLVEPLTELHAAPVPALPAFRHWHDSSRAGAALVVGS